ncbi:expressed unknown protein [Seminavis robusta]|uniref:Auxin efflux carrier n=1 Tax=Seminavis robusta TaxID=568900 RepID=A0A9N8HGN5_9STRA|nr:expressed unknown protein [Seminavis robusta]|eukprot:Sro518_g158840.1 n/a (571) ;mRNA; r:37165-39064
MAPANLQSFYSTFSASIRSVGTAVTLAAVGVYLHRRECVSSEGKRTLARISQQVTFPLFLFTKICYCNQDWSSEPCPDVTKSLKDVWILLFWPAVVVSIGLLVGYAAAIVSGTPKSQRRSVYAACGFGNSTGLPITLLTVVHANFPETSDLGKIDPTLFLSVYLLLYPVLQWGVGGWLLAPEEEAPEKSAPTETLIRSTQAEEGLTHGHLTHTINRNVLNNRQKETFYMLSRKAIGETDASLYISDADLVHHFAGNVSSESLNGLLPKVHQNCDDDDDYGQAVEFDEGAYPSTTPLSPIMDETEVSMPDGAPHIPIQQEPSETTGLLSNGEQHPYETVMLANTPADHIRDSQRVKARDSMRSIATEYETETFCETCNKVLSRCLQPPVVGALAGIFVAATPLRGVFVDLVDRSSSAPLEWFFDGLYAVGQAAVPINMIILGCNLSASYMTQKASDGKGADSKKSNLLSQKAMISIVIGKMLVMPIIGILLALFLEAYVLDIPSDIDGSFYLVLMIVFITPTANNVMVMVELSGSNTKEGIAQVIALQYACAPLMLSLTMSLVVGIASSWE